MHKKKSNYKDVIFHQSIQKLLNEKKYIQAEKYLSDYFYNEEKNDLNDYLTLSFVKTLRINKKHEEAIQIVLSMLNTDNRNYFLHELVLTYISINNLEEAYKYFLLLKKEDNNIKLIRRLDIVEYFLTTKLYELDPVKYNIYKDIKQKEFDLKKTADHVINEHSFMKHPKEKSYFYDTVNIYELLEQIKTKILDDNLKYSIDDVTKIYYFKMNNFIGISNQGNNCDTILVITTWDNNILTMYPVHNIENSKLNFLNEQKEDISLTKVKRKSQIEKFNQKYNL